MNDLIDLLREKSASDPRLRSVIKSIEKGTADFSDTSEYSEIYSNLLGKILSGNVLDLTTEEREELCCSLLQESYDEQNELLFRVQGSLDEKAGLHIKPQKADFPLERVQQLAHSLVDPTVPDETIRRRAGSGAANISKSFHDDYMKENAKFRNDAGLKCYITRMGTSCCPWCSEVAGRFRFGDQPDDIFRRHDNCDCTIIYDNQVLRGQLDADGGRTKTWEQIGEVPADYQPTVFTQEQAKALEQRNLSQFKGLTNGGGSGIIISNECEIHPNKVQNFFLKPGAKHSNEFFDVGYTTNDAEKLTNDLKNSFDYSKAVDKSVSESGIEKFSIFTELGVDKKKRFRTVWQKDTPDSVPRIITAHREDG